MARTSRCILKSSRPWRRLSTSAQAGPPAAGPSERRSTDAACLRASASAPNVARRTADQSATSSAFSEPSAGTAASQRTSNASPARRDASDALAGASRARAAARSASVAATGCAAAAAAYASGSSERSTAPSDDAASPSAPSARGSSAQPAAAAARAASASPVAARRVAASSSADAAAHAAASASGACLDVSSPSDANAESASPPGSGGGCSAGERRGRPSRAAMSSRAKAAQAPA